jgi:hypothetical protein
VSVRVVGWLFMPGRWLLTIAAGGVLAAALSGAVSLLDPTGPWALIAPVLAGLPGALAAAPFATALYGPTSVPAVR